MISPSGDGRVTGDGVISQSWRAVQAEGEEDGTHGIGAPSSSASSAKRRLAAAAVNAKVIGAILVKTVLFSPFSAPSSAPITLALAGRFQFCTPSDHPKLIEQTD